MKAFWSVLAGMVLARAVTFSAAFVNLDFDAGDTNGIGGAFSSPGGQPPFSSGAASVARLLPGWTLERGTAAEPNIYVDTLLASIGYASLYSPAMRVERVPVAGRFSFGMWPFPLPSGGPILEYTLKQTGDIPPDAQTIHFVGYGGQLELRINDSVVPLIYVYDPFNIGSFSRRADV